MADYANASAQLTKDLRGLFKGFVPEHFVVRATDESLEGSESTPAWTTHATAEVAINLARLLEGTDDDEGAAERLAHKITDRGGYSTGRKDEDIRWVYGMLAHEAAHCGWSDWNLEIAKLDPRPPMPVVQTMILFEELRVEYRASNKGAAPYLRHSFEWLLRTLEDPSGTPQGLAHCWALVVGRYKAGVAAWDEVDVINTIVRSSLTDDVVDTLYEILEDAVQFEGLTPNRTARKLAALAYEWLEVLGVDPEESSESMAGTCVHVDPGDGDEGDGEGEGGGAKGDEEGGDEEGKGSSGGDDDGDGDEEGTREAGADTPDSVTTDEDAVGMLKAAIRELGVKASGPLPVTDGVTLSDPAATAAKVFGGKAPSGDHWEERTPTPKDRGHAHSLARTFEALALPSIAKLHVPSDVPPGRLRGREAVRRSAERSMGLMATATPWERTKRLRTTTKPVIVGVMTDTSGSMSWAKQLVADFAWTVSTAGIRVGARTAAVTFGNRAEMVHRPGEVPSTIRVREANGSTEMFDQAAAALDGVLHLSTPMNAAKVLFIVSDGELVEHGEPTRARLWIEKFTEAGTLVCWVGCSYDNYDKNDGDRYGGGYGASQRSPGKVVFVDRMSPEKLMPELEATILKAARGMT